MTKFAAFLRGINVGGNKLIKMDDLKKCFAALAFKNVKTILASGNVLFESTDDDEVALGKKILEFSKSPIAKSAASSTLTLAAAQSKPWAFSTKNSAEASPRGTGTPSAKF